MAELLITHQNGMVTTKPLEREQTIYVGNSPKCEIQVEGAGIRSRHCHIRWAAEHFRLETEEGVHDVKLNGTRTERARLAPGDVITVGHCSIKVKAKIGEEGFAETAAEDYYVPIWRNKWFLSGIFVLLILVVTGAWLFRSNYQTKLEKTWDNAETQRKNGLWPQAADAYKAFLETYPDDSRKDTAKILMHRALVSQFTKTAPVWPSALEEIKKMLKECQEIPEFSSQKKEVADEVVDTASGLAALSEKNADANALALSNEAKQILETNFRVEDLPKAKMDALFDLQRQAKFSIEKSRTKNEVYKKMDELNDPKAPKPIELYLVHEEFYHRYPDLREDPVAKQKRDKARKFEQAQVSWAAATANGPAPKLTLKPSRSVYRNGGEASLKKTGTIFVVQVADSVYGLDTGTGEYVWRYPSGPDPSFSPFVAKVRARPFGVLVHRTMDNSIVMLKLDSGEEIWRTAIAKVTPRAWSKPEIVNDDLYIIAQDQEKGQSKGRLVNLRASSGAHVGDYIFPQRLTGSPFYDLARRMVMVFGERVSLYSLNAAAHTCDSVLHLNHDTDSLRCSPVFAGRFLFVAEQKGKDQTRLRCLVLSEENPSAQPKQEVEIRGIAWHSPVVQRGRVFVTTDYNHISVFDLADRRDDVSLTRIQRTQEVFEKKGEPPYAFAPTDDEFYLIGSELLNFKLVLKGAEGGRKPDLQLPLPGHAFLPPEYDDINGRIIVAVRNDSTGLVNVIAFDHRSKEKKKVWTTELGRRPDSVALDPSNPDSLTATTGGVAESIPLAEIASDKVVKKPLLDPKMSGDTDKNSTPRPVREWTDGLLQWRGIGQNKLTYFPKSGPPKDIILEGAANSVPVLFEKGILVACQNGLMYAIDPRTGAKFAEPFIVPIRQTTSKLGPVAVLDEHTAVVVAEKRILKIELPAATGPNVVRQFNSVVESDIEGPQVDFLVVKGKMLLMTIGQELRLLRPTDLKPAKKWPLEAQVSHQPITIGGKTFILTDRNVLFCMKGDDENIDIAWKSPLESAPINWLVTKDDTLWLSFPDGKIVQYNINDGKPAKNASVGRSIVQGPWMVGEKLVVMLADGSFTVVQ